MTGALCGCRLVSLVVVVSLFSTLRGFSARGSWSPCCSVRICAAVGAIGFVVLGMALHCSADGILLDVPEVSIDTFVAWVATAASGQPFPSQEVELVRCG